LRTLIEVAEFALSHNYETPDPSCQLDVTHSATMPAGRSFLNLSVTPQGQAAVLYVAAVE
jgi:hypothetical protein